MPKKTMIARARGAKAKPARATSPARAAAKKPGAAKTRPAAAAAKPRRTPAGKPGSAAKPAKAVKASTQASVPAPARTDERRRSFPEALRLRTFSASLTVDDLARSLDFYVKGLGFTVKERWEQDGKLAGVMLVAGTCSIGLAQDDWAKGRGRVKGVGVSFYAETGQSLDLIATLAREHGIKVDGPKKAPWGQRLIEVVDPDGFKLSICWPMT